MELITTTETPNEREDRRAYEELGKRVPLCPACKTELVARQPGRRFMENNRYVECFNGHVWELDLVAPGGEGR